MRSALAIMALDGSVVGSREQAAAAWRGRFIEEFGGRAVVRRSGEPVDDIFVDLQLVLHHSRRTSGQKPSLLPLGNCGSGRRRGLTT
jgi:hypothetical protein